MRSKTNLEFFESLFSMQVNGLYEFIVSISVLLDAWGTFSKYTHPDPMERLVFVRTEMGISLGILKSFPLWCPLLLINDFVITQLCLVIFNHFRWDPLAQLKCGFIVVIQKWLSQLATKKLLMRPWWGSGNCFTPHKNLPPTVSDLLRDGGTYGQSEHTLGTHP